MRHRIADGSDAMTELVTEYFAFTLSYSMDQGSCLSFRLPFLVCFLFFFLGLSISRHGFWGNTTVKPVISAYQGVRA